MNRRDMSPTGEPKGAPDPDALRAVQEANRAPEDATVMEPGQSPEPAPASSIDPEVVTQFLAALSANPEFAAQVRAAIGVPEGVAGPVVPEDGWRDYGAPELSVMGGKEVIHPEWEHGRGSPLPPSSIKPYLRADGTKTDYAVPLVERRRRQTPIMGDNGKPAISADGNQIYEETLVDVVVDLGAAHDSKGRPIKTPEYRQWLVTRRTGARLDSNVRSQIRAGTFGEGDVPSTMADGTPLTQGAAVPMPVGAEE